MISARSSVLRHLMGVQLHSRVDMAPSCEETETAAQAHQMAINPTRIKTASSCSCDEPHFSMIFTRVRVIQPLQVLTFAPLVHLLPSIRITYNTSFHLPPRCTDALALGHTAFFILHFKQYSLTDLSLCRVFYLYFYHSYHWIIILSELVPSEFFEEKLLHVTCHYEAR